MRTWEDFKKKAKEEGGTTKEDIEEIETIVSITNTIINRRNELGYSQRELASLCGLPQSSIARIESCVVIPKLDTLIKIMRCLRLTLEVTDK